MKNIDNNTENDDYFRLLAENTTDVIICSELTAIRRYVSPSSKIVFGFHPDELIGKQPFDYIHPDDIEGFRHAIDALVSGKSEQLTTTQRYKHKNGSWIWIESSFKLTFNISNGEANGYVASLRDITERKATEDALRLSEERLALALDGGSDGLWDWDIPSGQIELSRRWYEMLGYEEGEISPHISNWSSLIHAEDADYASQLLSDHLEGLSKIFECEYRLRTKKGTYVWTLARGKVVSFDEARRPSRIVGTHIDISRRKTAEQQLAYVASHDALTGLPNRLLFRDRLEREVRSSGRHGSAYALLACDLDGFKAVNDARGHPVGDTLLRAVGERLKTVVRQTDTLARLGGDEFAIIMSGIDLPHAASAMAQRVIEAICEPFDLNGHNTSVGISVGIALGPQDGYESDEVYKNADLALYRAKAAGRNTFRFYERGMDAAVAARHGLELDLREAIQRGGFALHYQPIVNAATDAVCGFEALMRWRHPLRGPISPTEFIPIAEETGLIVALGRWALHEACREAVTWPDSVLVAVNISMIQFAQPGLDQTVMMALDASGLPAHRLELEITESVLMEDAEGALACLHRLRALGVRIALDDFGTGYSSLSYLRRFRFDKIKIDRSFIRDIANPDTAAIVRAIVGIGGRLGAAITAEGVETQEQLEQVRKEGCTQVQGYLFSRPLPAAEALAHARVRPREAA